jgi:hypothetical protein
MPPAAEGPKARPFGNPRLRGGASPTPQHRSGSRGKVGGTSESARPPARRCAVVAGGLIPSGMGRGCIGGTGHQIMFLVGAIHESPWLGLSTGCRVFP